MSNGTPHGTDSDHTFDVIVIGLGPGGERRRRHPRRAGAAGARPRCRLVGGECPYWGCIPSKMMVRAADALAEARRVAGLAGTVGVTPDWGVVARASATRPPTTGTTPVAVDRLVGKGATFVRGRGVIDGPGRVDVDGTAYTATTGIVVNTGTTAAVPPIEGLADTPYWTNHEIVEATELPASIIVLGGGAIGCELSQVMARFGVEVTVVEAADRILALEEPEASTVLAATFESEGIACARVAEPRGRPRREAFTVTLADGSTLAPRSSSSRPAAAPTSRPSGCTRRRGQGRSRRARRRPVPRHRRRVGGRRHHRQGRLHPRVDVSGRHRRPRHPR